MYGTLDAAEQWGLHYASRLIEGGFIQGGASPCHFRHEGLGISVLVHGDDFLATATQSGIDYLSKLLRSHYELKEKTLGFGPNEEQELRVLGRIISCHS